jgi:hypothetical protein
MATVNPSDLRLASREKPSTGESGVSDWVWVDSIPWGACIARYDAQGDFWEDRESGRRLEVEKWAGRWTD